MKINLLITVLFVCVYLNPLLAQHNAEFTNQGAIVKIQGSAIMTVQGDMHNLGGTLSNDGLIEVQGNLYSDATFQQRGTGTVRLENNDVNVNERQFISGSYAVRGGTGSIGVNDGSFYNLELANTAGIVYLVGAGDIADVRNAVNFLPAGASGSPARNNIVTHNIGMTGAITYPGNGASYSATFGMMNNETGSTSFLNNSIDVGGNMSAIDRGYVIGKLRRSIAPSGGVYGYVLGLEPAAANLARGFQYIHLDMQVNTYDVIESYFQQGSPNNNTVATECSGYQMDDFWGNRHGEWHFTDMNGIQGGNYEVQVWPQDPTTPWSGAVWTISKDDVFEYPSADPLHNDCGPTTTGLDRGPFNGFSDFGVVSSTIFVPIELLYLTATPIDNKFIKVDWATAKEENVDYFEVQRSLDGFNYQTIATQDAAGTSTVTQYYAYDDYNVLPNVDYYYRIKTIDDDATFDHTHTVVASVKQDGGYQAITLYPNPVGQGGFILDIKTLIDKPVQIKAFDAIGQLVYSRRVDVLKGVNSLTIDSDDWSSGTYFIHIMGTGFSEVKEMIKVTH
jgi:hypothetical protein